MDNLYHVHMWGNKREEEKFSIRSSSKKILVKKLLWYMKAHDFLYCHIYNEKGKKIKRLTTK